MPWAHQTGSHQDKMSRARLSPQELAAQRSLKTLLEAEGSGEPAAWAFGSPLERNPLGKRTIDVAAHPLEMYREEVASHRPHAHAHICESSVGSPIQAKC